MLQELHRRLDVIDGYVCGVNERAETNMPDTSPPFPNRYLRRMEIAKQINESLFSPNLHNLHESVPRNFVGPQFIRQLLEAETREERLREEREKKKTLYLDGTEYRSLLAIRNTKKAPVQVYSKK